MKENHEIDKLVEMGLEFKNQNLFQDSIDILERIISEFPNYPKRNGIKIVLAGNYYQLQQYEKTIDYAYEVISKRPKAELASMLLYLSYANLDEPEKAYMVLFSYLDKYPADLFKDTLEELLEGLQSGYGTSYKNEIILHAKKNNVI